MIGFVKVAPGDVVAERVTVTLRRKDGAVLGSVSSIGTGQGGDEVASTEGDDPPVEFALRIARELATAKGETTIDVVDPDGLWTRELGVLTDA